MQRKTVKKIKRVRKDELQKRNKQDLYNNQA